MTNYSTTGTERTLGTIIKELTADLSNLIRSEIALLKLELKESFARLGGGAALMVTALFLGLIGIAFLFVTITLGLVALGVPAWLSSLIVTVVLFIASGILVLMGKKKLRDVQFVPTQSIGNLKTDIDSLKADVARMRSR